MTPPLLIAHRGLPRRHRENTLAGFVAASAAGADGWELDVHLSADGVVVVHHDPVLPPAAGDLAGQPIAALTWATLQRVPVGPGDERIPSLDTVLAAATEACEVFVEVKGADMVPETLACLRRHPDVRTAVHGFDHRVPAAVHAADARIPVGILVDAYLLDAPHALRGAGARDFWPHRGMVDAALVRAIHAEGGRVIVWTVNDVDEARALAAIGVDGICTDVVDVMRDAFGR